MQPRHQAIVAGLALSLAFGAAAPAPVFAQTETQQTTQDADSETFGNSDATVIADDTAKLPAAGEFDRAEEYQAGSSNAASGIMTLSLNSLVNARSAGIRPMALSSEMKYFAQNESGSNYNLGFSSGDGYYAMGFYQFDRRYSLVDFMSACYSYNPQKYGMFKAVIDRGSELKSGTVYDTSTKKLTEIGRLAEEAWHAAYAADPAEFAALQDAYGYTNYYLPVESIVARKGLDLSGRADCLKGLCWGLSNLFGQGGCQKFFDRASLSNSMTDKQAVTAICDAVVDYMTNESTNQYAASYANRYKREKQTCLDYLAQHAQDDKKDEGAAGGSESGSTGGEDAGSTGDSGSAGDANNGSGGSAGDNAGGSGGDEGSAADSGSNGSAGAGAGAATPGAGANADANAGSTGNGAGDGNTNAGGDAGSSDSGTSNDGDQGAGSGSGSMPGNANGAGASNGPAAGSGSPDDAGSGNDAVAGTGSSDNGGGSGSGDGSSAGASDGAKSAADGSDSSANAKDAGFASTQAADTATSPEEKLPATADASSIALAVSTMLSAVGVGTVIAGKRHAGEKVPFEDGFRG